MRKQAIRRKLLRACGLLVPLMTLASAWVFQTAQPARERQRPAVPASVAETSLRRAVRALAQGDMSRARKEISAALVEAPDHAPALLILACIELEENNRSAAREVIARLRAAAPTHPEPKLLELLLAHRERALSSAWGQAFLQAWSELDRPDFQHSPLLPAQESLSFDDQASEEAVWHRATSLPIRIILALSSPKLSEERARWMLQQVPTMQDPALLTAASETLSHPSLPATLRQESLPILRQRLGQLREQAPLSIQSRLQLLLMGTAADSAFNARDLEALDAISLLPTWKETSSARTYNEARSRLREAGLPAPGARAFLVAERGTGHGSALLLLQRAHATREKLSEDDRRWMGRMLWRIGSRLSEHPSYLEHSVGLLLMESGAEGLNDSCGQSEAYTRQDELSASAVATYKASPDRWPRRAGGGTRT